MDTSVILLFAGSLLIGTLCRRRAYLGPLDPLRLLAVNEAVWATTMATLSQNGVATHAQVEIFAASLVAWWAAWFAVSGLYGRRWVNAVRRFFQRLARLRPSEANCVLWLYAAVAAAVLVVTYALGGGGDNRLVVSKLLRPVEGVTAILPPIVLFLLMIRRSRTSRVLLVAILLQMILTGGKSAILQILLPLTGALLIGRFVLSRKLIWGTVLAAIVGFGASSVVNYGTTNPADILQLLIYRISLDGDVYILSLTNDLLYQTTTTSLASYLLGPLIKIFALPIDVDVNLGAQIGSILSGEDTPNGPNAHWSILMLAYGVPFAQAILLSVLVFGGVVLLKLRMLGGRLAQTMPMSIVIPLGSFCLQYPQTFFADPTYPVIYLVQSMVVAVVLSAFFFFLESRSWPNAHRRHGSA